MKSMKATLRLSAAMFLVLTAAAAAGPAEDLKGFTVAAFPPLQITGASVGEARDDGASVVLSNLTFASGGERPIGVKVAKATITGGIGSGDSLNGAQIRLEGIEGTAADGQAYRLPAAEITGAQGSLAAILASFASREPFFSGSTEQALTQYSANRIAIPSMTIARRRGASTEEATYNNLAIADYARGRITELTVAGMTVTRQADASKLESGLMRFNGFDLTAGLRTGGGAVNALDSATIDQMRGVSDKGAPFSIEKITIGRVTMRPGERSLMALSQSLSEVDPSGSDEAARNRSLGAAAELFSRLDFDRVELVNFRNSEAGKPGAGEFQRIAISGVAQGKIGAIELNGLSFADNEGQRIRMGRIAIESIDASGLVALGKDIGEGRTSTDKPVPASAYPDVRRLVVEDFSGAKASGQSIGTVQRFEVEAGQRIGLVPTRVRARLTGFEAPITDPAQQAQLAPLGIEDKLMLGAEMELEYVESARELRVRTLNVDVSDVGALNLALTVGGIDRAAVEGLPGTAAVLGLSAKAGRLVLTYKEDGGVAALLSHLAEQAGVEEDDFTEQLKTQVRAMVAQAVPDKALAGRIASAVATFLDDPNSLVVTATPKGDVPLAALALAIKGSPLGLLPMFNVTVEANK